MERQTGILKDWNDEKGFGFLRPEAGGPNIFIHIKDIRNSSGKPSIGDKFSFVITPGRNNRIKATDAIVITRQDANPERPIGHPIRSIGILKSWDGKKGFGFIRPKDNGRDVFIHISDFKNNDYLPTLGDTLDFRVLSTDDGKGRAHDAFVRGDYQKRQNRIGLARWLLALLPFALSVYAFLESKTPFPALGYGILSSATFLMYAYDKSRATQGGWRVSEKRLHALELFGGWPGGLLGQALFRHKTRKISYQAVFWMILAIHAAAWGYYLREHHGVAQTLIASVNTTSSSATNSPGNAAATPTEVHAKKQTRRH